MRETKADCTIYSPDGSGCNGYTAQLYSGQKLKWLDENDVETLIGSRGLKEIYGWSFGFPRQPRKV